MNINLEIGKRYRLRDGRITERVRHSDSEVFPFEAITEDGFLLNWTAGGETWLGGREDTSKDSWDVVEEYVDDKKEKDMNNKDISEQSVNDKEPPLDAINLPEGWAIEYRGLGWSSGGQKCYFIRRHVNDKHDHPIGDHSFVTPLVADGVADYHYWELIPPTPKTESEENSDNKFSVKKAPQGYYVEDGRGKFLNKDGCQSDEPTFFHPRVYACQILDQHYGRKTSNSSDNYDELIAGLDEICDEINDKYVTRPTTWHQYPKKDGSLSDYTTVFEIVDECAGEFVKVTQPFNSENNDGISIEKHEWDVMKKLIDHIFGEIEKHEHEHEEEE